MEPVHEVRKLTDQIMAAARGGDFAPFVAALDDDLEVFDHLPFRFEQKERFIEHLGHILIGAKSVSFNFHHASVRAFGNDVAVLNAYDHLVTAPVDGGAAKLAPGRTTWVFARRPQGWKIVSAHFSPMPP